MIIAFAAIVAFFAGIVAVLPLALYIKNTDRDCRMNTGFTVRDYYRFTFGR